MTGHEDSDSVGVTELPERVLPEVIGMAAAGYATDADVDLILGLEHGRSSLSRLWSRHPPELRTLAKAVDPHAPTSRLLAALFFQARPSDPAVLTAARQLAFLRRTQSAERPVMAARTSRIFLLESPIFPGTSTVLDGPDDLQITLSEDRLGMRGPAGLGQAVVWLLVDEVVTCYQLSLTKSGSAMVGELVVDGLIGLTAALVVVNPSG